MWLIKDIIISSSLSGDVAQMVERLLSMHEVKGSMPFFSNFFLLFFESPFLFLDKKKTNYIYVYEGHVYLMVYGRVMAITNVFTRVKVTLYVFRS